MTARYDAAYVKREAIRRRQRALGIHTVPSPEVLDRIVQEHEVAAALVGRAGHDDLCEHDHPLEGWSTLLCYCAERFDAVERINARLDTATDLPTDFYESVTSEHELEEEGPR